MINLELFAKTCQVLMMFLKIRMLYNVTYVCTKSWNVHRRFKICTKPQNPTRNPHWKTTQKITLGQINFQVPLRQQPWRPIIQMLHQVRISCTKSWINDDPKKRYQLAWVPLRQQHASRMHYGSNKLGHKPHTTEEFIICTYTHTQTHAQNCFASSAENTRSKSCTESTFNDDQKKNKL